MERIFRFCLVTVAIVLLPAAGAAEDLLEVGIGAKGGVLFGGATEVPEDEAPVDPELYGMFGTGGGAGPALDVRYNKIIGLTSAVYFTNDTYDGDNEIENEQGEVEMVLTQTQSTTATHLPLLVKLSPPFDYIRPTLGLGLEFVFQNKANLSYSGDEDVPQQAIDERENRNEGVAANYTMFQATAGAEFDAGPFRIPVELRVGYNLGWDDSYDARVDEQPNGGLKYDGAYMGHFGFFTGILYRWDLAL